MNSRKIDLSASAAPSAISYIEKLSNKYAQNWTKMSCSIKKKLKKKLKPNSLGKYLPMYIQTTTILSQQYRIIRTGFLFKCWTKNSVLLFNRSSKNVVWNNWSLKVPNRIFREGRGWFVPQSKFLLTWLECNTTLVFRKVHL